jgi:hypothetical protein
LAVATNPGLEGINLPGHVSTMAAGSAAGRFLDGRGSHSPGGTFLKSIFERNAPLGTVVNKAAMAKNIAAKKCIETLGGEFDAYDWCGDNQ